MEIVGRSRRPSLEAGGGFLLAAAGALALGYFAWRARPTAEALTSGARPDNVIQSEVGEISFRKCPPGCPVRVDPGSLVDSDGVVESTWVASHVHIPGPDCPLLDSTGATAGPEAPLRWSIRLVRPDGTDWRQATPERRDGRPDETRPALQCGGPTSPDGGEGTEGPP